MVDIKNRVFEILNKTHLMSLGTLDDGGVWVSDVIFIFDENLNIYWMSNPDTRHSTAISKINLVSGTITQKKKSGKQNFEIQFTGKAEKIDVLRYDLACKHFEKRGKQKPEESDDVLDGDSWYILIPNKIELIDEENFGFEKQSLEL